VTDIFAVRQCSPHALGTTALPGRLEIEVAADGFLYNMVRNIVGALVEVGRGAQAPEWIAQVLAAKNRQVRYPTAPPHGLFLVEVYYDVQWSRGRGAPP
jgi:tRNA pseudouridine38-40 synthase